MRFSESDAHRPLRQKAKWGPQIIEGLEFFPDTPKASLKNHPLSLKGLNL